MVGSTLVEAGVCKDATGAFAKGAASLLQGSLELVTDAVSQAHDVLGYKVIPEQFFFLQVDRHHARIWCPRIPATHARIWCPRMPGKGAPNGSPGNY